MCKLYDESKNNQRMSKVAQDATYEEKILEAKRSYQERKKSSRHFKQVLP